MSEDIREIEDRLRKTESKAVETDTHIKTLFYRLDEFKAQLTQLIDKIDRSLVVTTRIATIETDVAALKTWVGQHTQEYTTLISEHRMYCGRQDARESQRESWWKDRFGKLLDWAVPAFVLWVLFIYKHH